MTSTEGSDSLEAPYRTLFQEGQPWFGGFDVQADMAIAYRVSDTLRDRLVGWKAHGYRAGLMTGLAWGHYESYLSGKWDGHDHQDEAQCMAEAKPRLHGPGIPYMVPGDSYARYLGELLGQAIEAGAEAIFLEEPEFWSGARYGPAFERAWFARYGAPLLDPSADARTWTMGGELQYALYTDLIDRLCWASADSWPRSSSLLCGHPQLAQLCAKSHRHSALRVAAHPGVRRGNPSGLEPYRPLSDALRRGTWATTLRRGLS